MYLSAVYIRFFRSFNFDYLRKASDTFVPALWDILDSDKRAFPFVKVPLEAGVTTVVGANESGKSQLLAAVQRALTGQDIERGDFCRYSQFFAVNKAMAFPDFGLQFSNPQPGERGATREQATVLLEDIDASLDNSVDADDLRSQLRTVRRTFALDEEPRDLIDDFDAFKEALQSLAYRPVNAAQEP